jgi:predicted PhzF superfamily epimerase YddE/YHI9
MTFGWIPLYRVDAFSDRLFAGNPKPVALFHMIDPVVT